MLIIVVFQIDFWKEPSNLFQPVDILVSNDDFLVLSSLLENNGIEFKVHIEDVQKLIEEGMGPGGARSGGSWHSRYHNLREVGWTMNITQSFALHVQKAKRLWQTSLRYSFI